VLVGYREAQQLFRVTRYRGNITFWCEGSGAAFGISRAMSEAMSIESRN